MIDIDWAKLRATCQKIIYLLTDPRPDRIYCYVGQTNNIERFTTHLRRDKWRRTPKRIWIDQLLDVGLAPEVHLLEICNELDANSREHHWIRVFEWSPAHILTNGYLERVSAGCTRVYDIPPPTVGHKQGILADLAFIIDLTQSYEAWLMKKVPIIGSQITEIDMTAPSQRYWKRKLIGRQFLIVDAGSGDLQNPFITKVPENTRIVGLTAPDDYLAVWRRLGLFAPQQHIDELTSSLPSGSASYGER